MPSETTATPGKMIEDPPQPAGIKPYCPVTVEPVVFLVAAVVSMTSTLQNQYIYYRITNGTVNQQGTSCYGNSTNSSEYQERQGDQAEAIQWATALELASAIPALVVTVIIGSISDKFGRKLNLIIPIMGSLLKSVVAAFVVQFRLPLAVFIPAAFINGLGGGYQNLVGGAMAYIADITVEGISRYFRHAVVLTVLGTAAVVSALGGGFWFEQLGFPLGILQPFWFSAGVNAFCLIYTMFALKETFPSKPGTQLCALSNITGVVKIFKVKGKTPTWLLGVLCFAFFLLSGVYISVWPVLLTYLVGPPFCWGPNYIGYLQAAFGAGTFLSMVAIRFLGNYPYGTMTAGYLSGIGCVVLVGLAAYAPNRDVALFTATVVGSFQSACNSLLRTTMSKMVGQEYQGSLFGLVTFLQNLASVIFVPLCNFVYGRTITIMPGLVFLVYAGIILVCAMLTGFVKFSLPEMSEDNLVQEEDDDHGLTKL